MDIIQALFLYHLNISIYDPWAFPEEVKKVYGLNCGNQLPRAQKFAAVIIAVKNTEFNDVDYAAIMQKPSVLFDVKGYMKN